MNKHTAAAVLVLGLGLAGCSAAPTPAETTAAPTSTANTSEQPCHDFETLTNDMATLIVDVWNETGEDGDADKLDAMPDQFDMLALKTDGATGERMAAVSDLLHETAPIVMSTSPDQYFDAIEAVQRACAADGVQIGIGTWK